MGSLLLYAAKRAVIDTLTAALPAVQVSYAFPAAPQQQIIYGGAARLTRTQGTAEWNIAIQDASVVDIWLRVSFVDGDARAAETVVETLAGSVLDALTSHAGIGAGLTFSELQSATAAQPIVDPSTQMMFAVQLQMQIAVYGTVQ